MPTRRPAAARMLHTGGNFSSIALTSWPSVRTDIVNAGGEWVDHEVVVDHGLVSSRKPDDLPAFCGKLVEEFAEWRHDRQLAGVGASAR